MWNNSVIIASDAGFLASMLQEKLQDADFKVFIVSTQDDLATKLKVVYPRFIFIEHCFNGLGTDDYIQRMVQHDRCLRIIVWAVTEISPVTASRYITAGAESYFSLRDTDTATELALHKIAKGQKYRPAYVQAELERIKPPQIVGADYTVREIEVIKLTGEGRSNEYIGEALNMTLHTVKFHRANIYRKSGCTTTHELMIYGLQKEIIPIENIMQMKREK